MLPELFLKYSKVCRRLEVRIDSEQKYEEVDGYGMSLIFNNLEAGKLGFIRTSREKYYCEHCLSMFDKLCHC
jgi:hypothetical protein